MSVQEYWGNLVAAALLGTDRQAPPEAPVRLAPYLENAPNEPEKALLHAATLTSLYVTAAREPTLDTRLLPTPCEPEVASPISSGAEAHLMRILNGERRDLLPEWLRAVQKANKHLPAAQLPALLELGKARPELHGVLQTTAGRRGLWLSEQNPDWVYLLGSGAPEEIFQNANGEARVKALRAVRQQDPERARALLEESWPQESHAERPALLAALEVSLTLADEVFLEQALDDKRKEVHSVAADLLARLPDSQLANRLTRRVQPLLTYHPSGGMGFKKAKLDIHLPEACDALMQRDGIEAKRVPPGMGERAWWLKQMISRVLPTLWGDPVTLIAASGEEWRDLLHDAWLSSSARFRDQAVAASLLKAKPTLQSLAMLVPVLTDTQRHDLASHFFTVMPALEDNQHPGLVILSHGLAWDEALERLVSSSMSRAIPGWRENPWRARGVLTQLATLLPPATLKRFASLAPERDHPLFEPYLDFLNTLEFRKDMLEAIHNP